MQYMFIWTNFGGIVFIKINEIYVKMLRLRFVSLTALYRRKFWNQIWFLEAEGTINARILEQPGRSLTYTNKKREKKCRFVYFRKSFAYVNRRRLLFTLVNNNVGRESCSCDNSDVIECIMGVGQRCNVFPFLFYLYINELYEYLKKVRT